MNRIWKNTVQIMGLILAVASFMAVASADTNCPHAIGDQATTFFGSPIGINVLSNDEFLGQGDYTLGFTQGTNGGTVYKSSYDTLTYRPPAGSCDTVDTFTYTIISSHCTPSMGTVTVYNMCQISCPVATDDQATTAKGVPVIIDVLANDKDTADTTIKIISDPAHGSVAFVNNKITYTPDTGYCDSNMPDSFEYSLCKPGCDESTATVTVTVTCPVCPVAMNDQATTPKGTPVIIDVLANDKDTADTTIKIITDPAHGSVAFVTTTR